jgi:mannitol-1-phosphate 5-dehydrogenase
MGKKSILIFGAGKIGRSFIGQLFGLSGYEVVFSDIDKELVDLLNLKRSYCVVIKGEKEEKLLIPNVRAINGSEEQAVIEEVCRASIMAIAVGKNALGKIIPNIAKGLVKRFQYHRNSPLDIIIAENMRSANEYIYRELQKKSSAGFSNSFLCGIG